MVSLEGWSKVSFSLRDHLQTGPVCMQDPGRPRSHTVTRQDIEAPFWVQVDVFLLEIQEDGVNNQLPN